VTSPQWIRPSVDEYERLQERLSLALKSLAAAEAKLADERKHADALADKLSILALGRINRTEVTAHFARRNAEKEESNG